MTQWQSMETAPKDGTTVLLLCLEHLGDYETSLHIGFWGDKLAGYAPDAVENYAWLDWGAGIVENNYVDAGESWAVLSPTHWMPLPPPPVTVDEIEDKEG